MRARLLPLLLLLLVPARALAFGNIGPAWPLSDSPRFWILGEGLYHLTLDTTYFRTDSNYNETGAVHEPPELGRVHYTNTKVHFGFGFAPRLSLYAQMDGRAVMMRPTEGATIDKADNYGFGDAFLAFRWLAYRSRATDRVYPSEWAPETFLIVGEGSWKFPAYDTTGGGKPPLGDQSNDFTSLGRIAWYTNEWLSFSGSAGYTYRTSGYASGVPWNLRADFSMQERWRMRFWADFSSFQRTEKSARALNTEQADPFPNGSFLFKAWAPTQRFVTLGAGWLANKEWEITGAWMVTPSGLNAAKGWGVNLGVAWRPYQVPEIRYEEYRQRQIERLQTERREYHRREVVKYGFRATVIRVSAQGNYIKIYYGEKDRVRVGDTFYVLPAETFDRRAYRPVASATVAQVTPDAAFLHVDERYGDNVVIQEGMEVRRVYFDTE